MNVVRVHEIGGFKVAETSTGVHNRDHASVWSFHDEQVVRDRHWHPKRGEVVFDVGAAFGSYTLPALAAGARVVAFEPADFNYELLKTNLRLNPELERRCLVVRDGLHSDDGWFDPDNSRFVNDSAMRGLTVSEGDQWIRVRTLDSFMLARPGIERVDWIKMDIEGAELDALQGGWHCINEFKPKLLIECHNQHDPELQTKVVNHVLGLGLGYSVDAHPHGVVSHAYFEVRK